MRNKITMLNCENQIHSYLLYTENINTINLKICSHSQYLEVYNAILQIALKTINFGTLPLTLY